MRRITNYNFSERKVSAIVADDSGNQYLFMAFIQDTEGNCLLRKVSAHNLNQIYQDVDVAVDEIIAGEISGNYIYLAVDDSSLIGQRYTKASPLGTGVDFDIPAGINETPVDIKVSGSYVYFLTPGSISGEIAKIIKFSLSGSFQETIELQKSAEEVTNANSLTIDSSGDLWVTTNTSPSNLVRVFDSGGWDFTVTPLVP